MREGVKVDSAQTLEQLEDDFWKEPVHSSSLVRACHSLRKRPLREFTAADLRIMISQNIGLLYLLPLALHRLEQSPMLEAYYYPGDLLWAVTAVEEDFWAQNSILYQSAQALVSKVVSSDELSGVDPELTGTFHGFLGRC